MQDYAHWMKRLSLAALAIALTFTSFSPVAAAPNEGMSKSQITLVEVGAGMAWLQAMSKSEPTRICSEGISTCLVNWQIYDVYTCPKGGRITTSGTVTGTIEGNNLATEKTSGTITQTITNWRCVPTWKVNGDPYLNISYSQDGFRVSLKTTGGWKATGPNRAKQSCQIIRNNDVTRYNCKPGGKWKR